MDLNRTVNPQNQPNSTRQERHISQGLTLHQSIFLPVMGIVEWLLQLKNTSGNASPFVTDYVTMLMYIVALFGYFGFFTMKLVSHALNSDVRECISNMTILFGTLAAILLLNVLVRAFRLFALSLWTIYLVRDVATKKSYMSVACHVFNKVKESLMINDAQPPPPSHIVLQTEDV